MKYQVQDDKITSTEVEELANDSYNKITNSCHKTEENIDSGLLEKEYTLEDILSELKLSGRYHIRFLSLLCFLLFISAGFAINYIFAVENVSYRCKYVNCRDSDISKLEQNSTLHYKCLKYELLEENGTCTENNIDSTKYTPCSEWVYDEPNTFVAEFNLGCQDWKRTLVGTSHSFGYMIGLLLFGPLADKFGRKKVIIFMTLVGCGLGILKSTIPLYWIYIFLEICESILGDNYSSLYTMAIEMVTTKDRPVVILLFSICITITDIVMASLAYLTTSWRTFLVLLYAPAILVILHIFCMDESLRWLLIKGRKAEAEQIIRKAMKMNNIVIDESKIKNLKIEEQSNITLRESLIVTFSSRKLLIRFVLCTCVWLTALFNGYALTINSVTLEGNKYVNFILVCICGTVAGFILLYVLNRFQRKTPLILSLVLTGLFCVTQSFIPKGYMWLSTLLYMCGKLNATITIRMAYLYTVELFPTYTRNTMLALCSAIGRIGAILAPLTPLLMVYWTNLPSFLVGVLSLLTATIVTMIPDTAEDVLPDNVKQAEKIGCK